MKKIRIVAVLAWSAAVAGCALAPHEQTDLEQPRAGPIAPVRADHPVVGLVLGAGGTRGFAHIGVLKVLEAEGLRPDVVVGVSSGAIVAALYAGGYDAGALEAVALGLGDYDLIDVTPFGPARVEGARLQDFVNDKLYNRSIETLDRPFAVVAAEEKSRRRIVFNHGNTGLAVRASAAVPGMFWPVPIAGVEYVDGGVSGRVPSPVARTMGADVVISVDVSWRGDTEADPRDIVIRPGVTRTRILDFSVKERSIAAGEEAAQAALPQIRARIAQAASEKRSVVGALH